MKITCSFESLLSTITGVSSVVEDALNSEEMKNIIFRIAKDKTVKLIGINQIIVYRSVLPDMDYSVECDEQEFGGNSDVVYWQIKSKELLSFLNAFKSIRRTKVDRVELSNYQNKVQLEVFESDIDTGNTIVSKWVFDNIPLKQNLLSNINMPLPTEGIETEEINKILLYTSSLLPIMQNGNNLYSSMVFGEDMVVAFNPAFTTLMNNELSSTLKGISMSYRAISFLKAVIGQLALVSVARTDTHICFMSDTMEAFIRYDRRVPDYSKYKELFTKNHGLSLDRLYVKDVLRRLTINSDAVEFALDCENVTLSIQNSKFSQDIPIIQSKGLIELGSKVTFKILPDVLSKLIIGEDNEFSPTLFLYLTPTQSGGYSLAFTDTSGFWFSVARIR